MNDISIKLNNLSFSYGKKEILRSCSCDINKGQIYVLLGKNGVGKTTLFKCILKQNTVKKNNILVNGKDISSINILEYSRLVSYVPQFSLLDNYDITVRDYLVQGRTPYLKTFVVPGEKEYMCSLKYAKMAGVDLYLDLALNELSGGQLQMVIIARALIQETPIIIMDEPLAALDFPNQSKVLSMIMKMKEEGKTIIFSSHNPNHSLLLDANILLMKNGRVLYEGTSVDIIDEEILSEAYDCSIKVYEFEGKKIVSLF